jgi:hypothetical protein
MLRASLLLALLAVIAALPRPALALANPASVFCAQSGGKSINLKDASGGGFGVCILPGGQMVEEWAWFRAHHKRPGAR